MAFRRKKQAQEAPAPEGAPEEWEQVLVAEEPAPGSGPTPTANPEASPPETPPDFEPVADEAVPETPVDALAETPPEPPAEIPTLAEPEPTPPTLPEPAPETPPEPTPELAPEPTPEPVPLPPPPDALPTPSLEPALAEPAPPPPAAPVQPAELRSLWNIPPEVEPFLRAEGNDLVLREPYLGLARRTDLERRLSQNNRVRFQERRWIPYRKESLQEVERQVDVLEYRARYESKSGERLKTVALEKRAALRGLEKIPPNIVAKRLVYETDGGFVVEITYRELGDTLTKYFTVPDQGDPRKTLSQVRSGLWAVTTVVSDDLVDSVASPGAKKRAPARPGKVKTWPIQNKWPVWTLHGIGQRMSGHLAKIGVTTTDQLRLRAPRVLARHCEVPLGAVRRWQAEAELLIVNGIHDRYAHILTKAGVRGIEALRDAEPQDVADAVNKWLAKTRSPTKPKKVGRALAGRWIRNARKLRKTVQSYPA